MIPAHYSPSCSRLLGGQHAEDFRKALSSDRINADAGGSGRSLGAGWSHAWFLWGIHRHFIGIIIGYNRLYMTVNGYNR